ncbi:magnesium/cobalt efflux protein [Solemya pervernicosa gill symbiont]|uniref:Magnesium and cobalt efflux protein CorC n=2 Tax=Gammaproteobacteria incertae sedis TaxID=118884 RepID=A0A1T2L723_9GAMM|nr:transporter associated domain-containing protein [Candidatus Reidiella endopervernicosa]OOZ40905.1 magnesium/cobalt efflux protein [Solemya pervernicosa gill symbiont]QKQ26117.1 CBS domain-containing protein [Candidatus Reidiella endopervernicosa]
MSEDRPRSGSGRSWLERLSQVLFGEARDQDELVEQLRDAERRDLIDIDGLAMIEGVIQVSEMQVRDIMIPRSQMVVVERDQSPELFIPEIIESGHSRFPVIGESRDEVVGILLAKDLLNFCFNDQDDRFTIRDLLRPPVFVPESKRLNVLLKEFRASQNHLAVVVDEYGGVAGMVTIEDVLEQIVGEIEDEYDVDDDLFIFKRSDSDFTVKALTPIDEFNEYFSCKFSESEFDTIAGLVVKQFGHLPKRGERVSLNRFSFEVVRADTRRIHLLRVTLLDAVDNVDKQAQSEQPPVA